MFHKLDLSGLNIKEKLAALATIPTNVDEPELWIKGLNFNEFRPDFGNNLLNKLFDLNRFTITNNQIKMAISLILAIQLLIKINHLPEFLNIPIVIMTVVVIPLLFFMYIKNINDSKKTTDSELAMIFASIPKNVVTLNLRGNNIIGNKSDKELLPLLSQLPFGVGIIYTDQKAIFRDSSVILQLLGETRLLISAGIRNFGFENIKLLFKISEKLFNQIFTVLEQYKNPEANLICGTLLEGRIPGIYQPKFSSSEYEARMEKRIHDAISFYSKASLHSKILPIAEFLLWEIKTVCPIPSVRSRLAQYDVTARNTLTTFNQFAKRECIQVPLFNEIGLFNNSQRKLNMQASVSSEISYKI